MAVNGQLSSDIRSTVVQTTDGTTPTIIYTTPAFLADDGGQVITFDIIGFDFTNDEIATAKIVVKLKNVGGTATMIGTPIHLIPFTAASSSSLINCAASVSISGSNLIVRVTGVTGRTIDWTCNRFPSLSVLDNWTAVDEPDDGEVLWWVDAQSRWEPVSPLTALFGTDVAGGDLTGTYPNPLVDNISSSDFNVGTGATSGTIIRALTGATGSAYGPLHLIGQPSSNASYLAGSISLTAGGGVPATTGGGDINIDAGTGLPLGDATTQHGKISLGGNGNTRWIQMQTQDGYHIYLGTEDESSRAQSAVIDALNIKLKAQYTGGTITLDTSNADNAVIRLNTGSGANTQIQLLGTGSGHYITIQGESVRLFVGPSNFEFDFGSTSTSRYVDFSNLSSGSSIINQLGTTVGAAGGASALPATPLGYFRIKLNGGVVAIPYYNAS